MMNFFKFLQMVNWKWQIGKTRIVRLYFKKSQSVRKFRANEFAILQDVRKPS